MLEQRTLTRRQTVARLAGVLAMAASIAAAPLPARADEANVLVFAAASLKNALDDVIAAYGKATGTKVARASLSLPSAR